MKNNNLTSAIYSTMLVFLLLLSSCEKGIYGTGDVQNYSPEVSAFDAVSVSLAADVSITKSEYNTLDIWAQENIMENMEIFVSNRTLYIKFDERVNRHKPISIEIYSPQMEGLSMSGANNVDVLSAFASDRFSIHSSGVSHFYFADSICCNEMDYQVSGTAYLTMPYLKVDNTLTMKTSGVSKSKIDELYCDELNYKVSGTASPQFYGQCNTQVINTSGTLRYLGLHFLSKACKIDVSGSADLDLYVEDKLSLKVSGSAKVHYKGQPEIDNHSSTNTTLIEHRD